MLEDKGLADIAMLIRNHVEAKLILDAAVEVRDQNLRLNMLFVGPLLHCRGRH